MARISNELVTTVTMVDNQIRKERGYRTSAHWHDVKLTLEALLILDRAINKTTAKKRHWGRNHGK